MFPRLIQKNPYEKLWENTLERSPIYQTLKQTIKIDIQFSIVF